MTEPFGALLLTLWLQFIWVRGQQEEVEQSPGMLSAAEGAGAWLNCTYRDSSLRSFFWYRQYPGRGPELLLSMFSSGDKEEGRLTARLSTASRHFSLHIRGSRHSDAPPTSAQRAHSAPRAPAAAPKPQGHEHGLRVWGCRVRMS